MLRDKKYIRNMEANILNGVGKSGMVVFLFRDKVEVENEKKQAEEHTWDGVQSVQVPTAKIMFFATSRVELPRPRSGFYRILSRAKENWRCTCKGTAHACSADVRL